MSEKFLLIVIAVSTSIMALTCLFVVSLWLLVGVFALSAFSGVANALLGDGSSVSGGSSAVTSEAELARERAEIERHLNSRN